MASELKKTFIERIAPYAMDQQIKYGIPASVIIAQAINESTYGTSELSKRGNNYFGVKALGNYQGLTCTNGISSEQYRAYRNPGESIEDHSKILLSNRYQKYLTPGTLDANQWIYALQQGGYAENPKKAQAIAREINDYNLLQYDFKASSIAKSWNIDIGYLRNNKALSPMQQSYQSSLREGSPVQNRTGLPLKMLEGHWGLPINCKGLSVSSLFGEPRKGHIHQGLDITTNHKNLPVFATEDNGKIVAVKPNNGNAGNMIVVEYNRPNDIRFRTTYMHLSSMNVKVGDIVQAGQQIGVSGNSGHSSGPHLHFEVQSYDNNKNAWIKYDPLYYLGEMSFRGNLNDPLLKRGQDVIAAYKGKFQWDQDLRINVPDSYLANMRFPSYTRSNDPRNWLAYMTDQNGEETGGIIATMVKHAASLYMNVLDIEAEEKALAMQEKKAHTETKEEQKVNEVRREREGVKPELLAQEASLRFSSEESLSNNIQQQNTQRLS